MYTDQPVREAALPGLQGQVGDDTEQPVREAALPGLQGQVGDGQPAFFELFSSCNTISIT